MTTVRVNVSTKTATKKARREKRDGRDVVIVPAATLPDDIVMNAIRYPGDEIAKGFASLEGTLAPLGHPTINGKFVSARDPKGIVRGWVGAWNENVRREKGSDGRHRVHLDKVIDVEVANQSEGGKRVLAAIDKGEPIHTSTGLLCHLDEPAAEGEPRIARDMVFDHDAILLDEPGAAKPEDGVGIFVNASGVSEDVAVLNSAIEDADRELGWALDSLVRALDQRERATWIDRMRKKLIDLFKAERDETTATNGKEGDDMPTDQEFKALSDEVRTLAANVIKQHEGLDEKIAAAVTNALKPVLDQQAALANAQKAKDDADHAELVKRAVAANLLNEADAKAAPLATLRALEPLMKAKPATALNGAFVPGGDPGGGYKLPAGEAS
jgi:hypothetical protein